MAEIDDALAVLETESRALKDALDTTRDLLTSSGERQALESRIEELRVPSARLASAEEILASLAGGDESSEHFLLSGETSEKLIEFLVGVESLEGSTGNIASGLADVSASVETYTDDQIERTERFLASAADVRERLESAFRTLIETMEDAHVTALAQAATRVTEAFASMQETLCEQFEERLQDLVEESAEALHQSVADLGNDVEEAAKTLTEDAQAALTGLHDHASHGVRRAVEAETSELIESVVEELAREAMESVAVTQLSTVATSALSPILPQLIAIRMVANAIKQALEIMRMGV